MAEPNLAGGGICRILVVDDDTEMRELVATLLGAKGHKVTTAVSGEDAVAKMRKDEFQLAIVDFAMPGQNGIETMDALKKIDPSLEVIIVTARGSQELASEAVTRGAYTFLVKPFDLVELDALIPSVREKISLRTLVGIYEMTRSVFAAVDLKSLLPNLVALANKILEADDTSLMLLDDDGSLRIQAASGIEEKVWRNTKIKIGEGVAGRVAQWKTGVTIQGPLQSDPRFSDLPSRKAGGSSLVYPILLDNDLVGILSANKKEGKEPFTLQDLRHAVVFCSQVSQAIQNAKLYEKLESARRAALEANSLKDELLYMTSHDLKSPLITIQTYAGLLLDKTIDDSARTNAVQRIKRGAGLVLTLVQQILRKGQVESAVFKLDRQWARVGEIVDEYLKDLELIAAMKKMRLIKDNRLPEGFTMNVDPTALGEIVTNLVGNAIKHTGDGGQVTVRLEISGEGVVLDVSDRGPGIGPEEQAVLFNKFQRGASVKVEGSGYGLAIVKRLAELHGGRVELAASSEEGSTFRVVLPVKG